MAGLMTYGDISPAIAAYAVVRMLKRAIPLLHIEKFGQSYPLPTNSTQTAKFRRYFLSGATGSAGLTGTPISNYNIPTATTPLVEGVTPSGSKLGVEDYTVTLHQYGDWVPITDVIEDTHTDNVLQQVTDILGEQAAVTIETIRFNVLKAGVNVFYANNVAGRSTVASAISLADQRRVTTALNRQNAKKITQVVASSPDYNTKSVEASYIALVHPDLETDLRSMTGFKVVADYGPHTTPFEGEIGSCEQVRYLTSTVFLPWGGAGVVTASAPTLRHSNTGGGDRVDVYPVIYIARDAYGLVPLKGKSALTPMVVNPKPSAGDPLGQRGSVGWKAWTGIVILQEAFLARLEVGATA
jgi:N4-gp56 family major capsid protein